MVADQSTSWAGRDPIVKTGYHYENQISNLCLVPRVAGATVRVDSWEISWKVLATPKKVPKYLSYLFEFICPFLFQIRSKYPSLFEQNRSGYEEWFYYRSRIHY